MKRKRWNQQKSFNSMLLLLKCFALIFLLHVFYYFFFSVHLFWCYKFLCLVNFTRKELLNQYLKQMMASHHIETQLCFKATMKLTHSEIPRKLCDFQRNLVFFHELPRQICNHLLLLLSLLFSHSFGLQNLLLKLIL